jgi:hypothetical protein
MAKAQREWAEMLAAKQPLGVEEVVAFVNSVVGSLQGTAESSLTSATAGLEAVVPLALFLSRSLGKVSFQMLALPLPDVDWALAIIL